MEFLFWQSGEGRPIENKTQMCEQENRKARWWGNGIPAMRELLLEIRLSESPHCWHFWSEGNERTAFISLRQEYTRQSKEQVHTPKVSGLLSTSGDSEEVAGLEWLAEGTVVGLKPVTEGGKQISWTLDSFRKDWKIFTQGKMGFHWRPWIEEWHHLT